MSSGVEIDRCGTCGGVFLDYGELEKIQSTGNDAVRTRWDDVKDAVTRRAYERARRKERPPINCPSCGDEMFEREWGYGSLVFVEVCIGCRGIWLDIDELEQLEEFYAS
jgi:Zn-finger nucleic acid-binding protein